MKTFIAAAVAALLAVPACAADGPAAVLFASQGRVGLRRAGGDWEPAPKAASLGLGSALRTARRASAEVLYADGTMVRLGEASELEIDGLELSAEERVFSVKALAGTFLFMVAKARHKMSRFAVRTPSAVCAVRGTDFAAIVGPDASEIGLFEGSLEVAGGGTPSVISPGQQATAAGGRVAVAARFTRLMEAERLRHEKLRKYLDGVRAKMAKRENFLSEHLGERDRRIKDFSEERRRKLDRPQKEGAGQPSPAPPAGD